ncbi:MAG: Mov34/MPN/PAD-1 family protein [Streptosporangiaceae bacterium]|nr:Mov34/MPN/PAD-1 family protein [Streptosporangiaceae bacterium]
MRAEIELYKGLRCAYFGSLSITMLLTEALRNQVDGDGLGLNSLGASRRTRVMLHFSDQSQLTELDRVRPVEDLRDSLGWITVQLKVGSQVVLEGKYGMGELMGAALRRTLRRIDPDEEDWSFAFRNLGTTGTDMRPAPDVEGVVDVDLREEARPLPFSIQQVESPAPEGLDVAALGINPDKLGPVSVLVTKAVHDLMLELLPLSERIEEGGFLLGRIQPATGFTGRHVTQVTHVTPATRAGASAVHFTFTPDSFTEVNQELAERQLGEELVGWYHTHLFPATTDIGTETGLSTTDIETHFATFRRDGQIAGLINLSGRRRVLRFFSKMNDEMKECPLWIGDERGRYRVAGTGLGRR